VAESKPPLPARYKHAGRLARLTPALLFAASLAALFTTFAVSAAAQKPPAEVAAIVQTVEAHYRDAKTLRADFLERYSEGGHEARLESGQVFFARPGRMRWEYQSPETKLFVSDGKVLWFYVPQDHTATRQAVNQTDDWRTPLALLTGDVKLSKLCGRIEQADGPPLSEGHVILRCWPRGETSAAARAGAAQDPNSLAPGAGFTDVFLEVDPTSGELSDVRVRQPGGVELEFRFGDWQMNPALPASLFRFDPPIGVAIVPNDAALDSAP
jgi:outer membrane lipoprotein carrier protein